MESSTQRTETPRVHLSQGFTWDEQDAYLFDIDGTLLRSRDRIHVDSFASSGQRGTGFEVTLAGIGLHSGTDTAPLREACKRAGVPIDVLEARTEAILEAMATTVTDQQHQMDLVRMPGVEEALRSEERRVWREC